MQVNWSEALLEQTSGICICFAFIFAAQGKQMFSMFFWCIFGAMKHICICTLEF